MYIYIFSHKNHPLCSILHYTIFIYCIRIFFASTPKARGLTKRHWRPSHEILTREGAKKKVGGTLHQKPVFLRGYVRAFTVVPTGRGENKKIIFIKQYINFNFTFKTIWNLYLAFSFKKKYKIKFIVHDTLMNSERVQCVFEAWKDEMLWRSRLTFVEKSVRIYFNCVLCLIFVS